MSFNCNIGVIHSSSDNVDVGEIMRGFTKKPIDKKFADKDNAVKDMLDYQKRWHRLEPSFIQKISQKYKLKLSWVEAKARFLMD